MYKEKGYENLRLNGRWLIVLLILIAIDLIGCVLLFIYLETLK
jgi:hypothetical protein